MTNKKYRQPAARGRFAFFGGLSELQLQRWRLAFLRSGW
jgi:hypothetical protein